MDVGTLVKEREGRRTCGVVTATLRAEDDSSLFIQVLWPSDEVMEYKSTFLEEMKDGSANQKNKLF